MSALQAIKDKAINLCRLFGRPVKAAASLTLAALVPGGGLLVEAVDRVLDCVHESAKDKWEFDQRRAEVLPGQDGLQRLEQTLDVLSGELRALLGQVVVLVDQPERARAIIAAALDEDPRYRGVQTRLGELAESFARMEKKLDEVRDGQGELLREVRKVKKRVTRLGKKNLTVGHDEKQRGPSIYDPF